MGTVELYPVSSTQHMVPPDLARSGTTEVQT